MHTTVFVVGVKPPFFYMLQPVALTACDLVACAAKRPTLA